MNDNIFKILGIQTREDCISNTLAYAINQCIDFRNFFLREVCNINGPLDKCKAYTRISAGESGIPDIVIVCEYQDAATIIIIENKLKADEGRDQTERYASNDSVINLHQKLCPYININKIKVIFIFLILFPDQEPSSPKFITKRYSDLLPFLSSVSTDTIANKLLFDWLNLVKNFYEKSKIDFSDNIYQKLQDEDGLDGSYLYFRTFFSKITLPSDLKNEGFFRASRQGRRYYGAIFSKQNWHPAEIKKVGDGWMLDPDNVFNIHFEPQFDVLNGVLNIYLHYEVNPYKPLAWVEKNILKEQYDAYQKRRKKFTEELAKKNIKGWNFGGGSNQIAKVQLNFRDYCLKDAIEEIEGLFQEMTIAIDEILTMLHGFNS